MVPIHVFFCPHKQEKKFRVCSVGDLKCNLAKRGMRCKLKDVTTQKGEELSRVE